MLRNFRYGIGLLLLILITVPIYIGLQVNSIYGGDAGDLVSAIITGGVAHPPGYPLYTILGIAATHLISFGTYAWRVGFISSIPGILSIIIIYDLLSFLTRRKFISFIISLVLAFLYPIWLYSIVTEVFALNNLFLILLLWLSFRFAVEKKSKYLFASFFIFGLSMTHHHIIIFLIPSLIYLIWLGKPKINLRKIIYSLFLFIAGLANYLYVPISSAYNPSLNWQGPFNIENFFALVTRAGYGTFRVGNATMHDPVFRLLDLWAFFDFVYKDFRILGIILFCFGIYHMMRYEKKIFKAFLIAFLSYLFFLFYASFPLTENFMVATYERFIQPLYILMILPVTFGLVQMDKLLEIIIGKLIEGQKKKYIVQSALACFLIFPIGIFIQNFPKLSILKNDFTAEKLGEDILKTALPNSILILSTDTPLFDTQYVYYARKLRPDVKLIHLSKLYSPYYFTQLKKDYPDIEIPDTDKSPNEIFFAFIEKNYAKFPVYSKLSFDNEKGEWIPYGLLFRFVEKSDTKPKEREVIAVNEKLWSSYNDPTAGSLSKYHNLMLSDTLPVYSVARQEIGYFAAKRGFLAEAEKHLKEAIRLYPQDIDSYIILSQVFIIDKRCQDAKNGIDQIALINKEDPRGDYLQSLNYSLCFKDEKMASFYEKLYETKRRGKETLLKKL